MGVPVFYIIRLFYLNGRLTGGSPNVSERPAGIRIDHGTSLSRVFGSFQVSLTVRKSRLIFAVVASMVTEWSWC